MDVKEELKICENSFFFYLFFFFLGGRGGGGGQGGCDRRIEVFGKIHKKKIGGGGGLGVGLVWGVRWMCTKN